MAGVFKRTKGPQRRLVGRSVAVQRADPRALELQAAMEILAEVFSIRPSEVEEMIQSRFEAGSFEDIGPKGDGLWPREFWIEG